MENKSSPTKHSFNVNKNQNSNTDNNMKNKGLTFPVLKKIKTLNKDVINDHSYIPRANVLKILVKHENLVMNDETYKKVIPLRKKICNYQLKNEKVLKEVNELRTENNSFINRYKMSGLLTPRSNSQFLKLGLSPKIIKDINSEGHKISDIINKTNIFDKSLLLNKKYANFARNVIEERNPELINDSKFITKMNENLKERQNNDLFTNSNYTTNNKNRRKSRASIYSKLVNKANQEKKTKVSISQLISEFNIINNDIKMISNYKNINERKKRRLRKKEMLKNLKKIQKELANLEANKIETNKNSSKIKSEEKEKILKRLRCRSLYVKSSNYLSSANPENKNEKIDVDNFNRYSLRKKPTNFNKSSTNKDFINDSSYKSLNFSGFLNSSNKNDQIQKNKRKDFNIFNKIEDDKNNSKYISRFNANKLSDCLSLEEWKTNPINMTEEEKNLPESERRRINLEAFKRRKNQFLQNLYNNMKIKSFSENKNDISEYLKKYKGTVIKEPNYEQGSHIYKIVNDFIEKSNEYNLPNEMNKIRNKTNLYSYKNTKKFHDIVKLNNKVQNLMYDYAEDILDLNNDIKK